MMNKTVKINKDQFLASVVLFSKIAEEPFPELILNAAKQVGPKLKDDMKAEVTLTEYEEMRYVGNGNE